MSRAPLSDRRREDAVDLLTSSRCHLSISRSIDRNDRDKWLDIERDEWEREEEEGAQLSTHELVPTETRITRSKVQSVSPCFHHLHHLFEQLV